ncbi:MAG TPA: bifunctional phosphopantothenoylcysteine decarboxylase/phosphopantothenate--cysteine ligase CoaBC [Candidatus Sphingobacterium stercoripullorum]|uniref:Coenzyme A biosynthesis bifunctional protein CoaBC n=1 Tax=Candidatus Sphingobacterium stercoripullorum TaxID=2838759 RepID=A0A9D1WAP5_9SPHI|nr:bifunctional phosphopantothenoylcysteine decarboxylase/phosphopantothenate--cysteine ligase CoaBC [Candidatus Sphingobacterium stercoripullorum]
MPSLEGKHIILGVTGGIAAYKTALLIRLLIKEKAEVKVIMTEEAKSFISPLTLSTLSKNPVYTSSYNPETGEWNNHVDLALWADYIVIAPATANTIAKMVHGLSDNFLQLVYLSARCPVYIAPAMDLDMWKHPSTISNINKLQSYGNFIVNPGSGELASGLEGEGRMAEPYEILEEIKAVNKNQYPFLQNKRILITAGPTHEPIDPVRFIGNHSTGKMGFAIAQTLAKAGAEVELVYGPTAINPPSGANISLHPVKTAEEMYLACDKIFSHMDIAIMSAAVADYTPEKKENQKIKKNDSVLNLSLKKTIDIAATLGKKKTNNQLLIGFALETENGLEHAKGKLLKKNLDLIVLNSLENEGSGFGYDTNQVTIINNRNSVDSYPLLDKKDVAKILMEHIYKILHDSRI